MLKFISISTLHTLFISTQLSASFPFTFTQATQLRKYNPATQNCITQLSKKNSHTQVSTTQLSKNSLITSKMSTQLSKCCLGYKVIKTNRCLSEVLAYFHENNACILWPTSLMMTLI